MANNIPRKATNTCNNMLINNLWVKKKRKKLDNRKTLNYKISEFVGES